MSAFAENDHSRPDGALRRRMTLAGAKGQARVAIKAPTGCDDHPPADEYGYFGPAAMVFDRQQPQARAHRAAGHASGAGPVRGRGRWWHIRWQIMLLAIVMMLGAGAMLAVQRRPELASGPVIAAPGDFWLIGLEPDGTALIGRLMPSAAGTVSLRVDVISSGPESERWDFLVACPGATMVLRSGDRWRDRLRTMPLGLADHSPAWQPRALRFACQPDARAGPWPGFEAARADAERMLGPGDLPADG